MNTADISNMGTGCSKLSDLLMVIACFRLPDLFPEVYEKSTLKMNPKTLKAVLVLVFVVLALSSYVSLTQFIGMAIFIAAAAVVMLVRYKNFKDADKVNK